MKGTDKFLIGLVAGVIVLVGAALALALLRPNEPSYRPEDTAEGVAHNYLLALQLEDYERAYSHLSPTLPGYPGDVEAFERSVQDNSWRFGSYDDDVSLAIESSIVSGDKAKILARKTSFSRGGLFDSGQDSYTFDMALRREEGAWKVTNSDTYWADCWDSFKGCR